MSTDYAPVRQALRVMVDNLHVVALKALESHWNVTGVHFGPLHALFGAQYEFVLEVQDLLAERIRALQGLIPASGAAATLTYVQLATSPPATMLRALLDDYTTLIANVRAAIAVCERQDIVTANMLQDVCSRFEKQAWILRMHVAGSEHAA